MFICYLASPNISTLNPKSLISEELETISFTCTANAKPEAIIQWIKDEEVLSNISNNGRIMITTSVIGMCTVYDLTPSLCETNSTLYIFNSNVTDSGIYTCNASNDYGSDTESATLTIQGIYVYFILCVYVHMHVYGYIYL